MSKPFDLQAAKAGKPISLRNGIPVTFLCHVPKAVGRRVVILSSSGLIFTTYETGLANDTLDSLQEPTDLVMASEKKSGWICLWRHPFVMIAGCYDYSTTGPFVSEDVARQQRPSTLKGKKKELLAIHCVIWEE